MLAWADGVANAISPWAQILGFVAIIGGLVVYARKLIRWLRLQFRESRAASGRAEKAANDASKLIETLIEELAEEKQLRLEEKDTRDREARRNDQVWAAYLRAMAILEQHHLPDRVRKLEEFSAEAEEHITGRLRLHGAEAPQ